MKFKLFYWALIGSIGVLSCEKNNRDQFEKDVQLMANLECEARHLKEERFNAANDIRFMEDSLAKHHLPLSPTHSQRIDSVKTAYTLRTGQLAGKITKAMDSLFAVSYKTTEQRQAFDNAIETKLQEVCK